MEKETKKRTPKETANAISNVSRRINKVLDAVPTMTEYEWFDEKSFRNGGFDKMIKDLCKKYKVKESHVRTVTGIQDGKQSSTFDE